MRFEMSNEQETTNLLKEIDYYNYGLLAVSNPAKYSNDFGLSEVDFLSTTETYKWVSSVAEYYNMGLILAKTISWKPVVREQREDPRAHLPTEHLLSIIDEAFSKLPTESDLY